MNQTKKIALFLGGDVVAHLIMNRVVPILVDHGYEPVLLFPKYKPSKKSQLPELNAFTYAERRVFNEVVYPLLEKTPAAQSANLTPQQLAQKYNLTIETVDNVNDPNFVSKITALHLNGALSIRCFQIFKPEIINVINETGFFYNLHPGILPEYRGVLSTARIMAAIKEGHTKSLSFGCTLHVIDPGIDTGGTLWIKGKKFDMSQTVFGANIKLAALGTQSIEELLIEFKRGNTVPLIQHISSETIPHYYTYPTKHEMNRWDELGITLYTQHEVIDLAIHAFSQPGTEHARKLIIAMRRGFLDFHQSNQPAIITQDNTPDPSRLRA